MSLTTPISTQKPKKYGILIVCEDTNSNFQYIDAKKQDCAPNAVEVDFALKNSIDAKGTQAHIIANYGVAEIQRKNNNFKNDNPTEPDFYKELYCVIDVDDNDTTSTRGSSISLLQQAYNSIDTANTANNKVNHQLIVSNECFEIWYILHFMDITIPLYRGTSPQIAQGLMADDNKIAEALNNYTKIGKNSQKTYRHFFTKMKEGSEQKAIERAKSLENKSTNTKPFDNPSTEIYKLVERLNKFKTL